MSVSPGRRGWQVLLVGSLVPLCWLGMQAVHEFGHVAALWASGGTVAKVVLHPLTISRTDPGRPRSPTHGRISVPLPSVRGTPPVGARGAGLPDV
jgi:hypothetical protein